MSHHARLPHHETIDQYLQEQRLHLYYSKPVMKHLTHFLDGVTQKGFSGTLTDIHALSQEKRDRSTLSRFLQKGAWDVIWLVQHQQRRSLQRIQKEAQKTGYPICVIVDDTICEKKKPLSQAKSPIQGTYYSFSHKDRKQVWGHQVVVVLLRCGDLCLPYAVGRYDKNQQSKIKWVCECIETLPVFRSPSYLLVDTWYNARSIVETGMQNGLDLIGGLKANRILYPQGIHTSAKQLASMVTEADTHLVTVGTDSYHVYLYEGACKGIDNAVVLLSWPQEDIGNDAALRCFLSMDVSLDEETILSHYGQRWSIEGFFQFMKEKFSFDRYQIRSTQAIDRFWALLLLAYDYVLQMDESNICNGLRALRQQRTQQIMEWVYFQGKQGIPLQYVQKQLCVA
jgi:hypothetical protein